MPSSSSCLSPASVFGDPHSVEHACAQMSGEPSRRSNEPPRAAPSSSVIELMGSGGGSDRSRLPWSQVGSIVSQVPRRAVAAGAAFVAGLLVLVLVPHALGPKLAAALGALPRAHPLPLWCGCGLFALSLLCSAGAWRTTISSCGGRIGRSRAAACYGVGSLVNSLLPARAGDAV